MSHSEPETRSSLAPPLTFLQELKGHRSGVRALAFSRDGAWLASADLGRRVHVWKGSELHLAFDPLPFWDRFPSNRRVHALAFSLDSKVLFVGLTDRLCAYDVASGKPLWRYRGRRIHAFLGNSPVGLAVSPATGNLAASFEDGHLGFWTPEGKSEEMWFDNDAPRKLAFSRDGSKLVGTDGFSVCIWDMSSHAKLAKKVPSDRIYGLELSPAADVGATRSLYAVSIWNVESGHVMGKVAVGPGLPLIAFSPVENLLAFTERGRIVVVDFDGEPRGTAQISDAGIISLAYGQDGILAGCSDGSIRKFAVL